MARPLLPTSFEPLAGAIGQRVQAVLSPWVNALALDVDVELGDEDQLD